MCDSRKNRSIIEIEMCDGSRIDTEIEINLSACEADTVSTVRLNALDTLNLIQQVQAVVTEFVTESRALKHTLEIIQE